ncbi:MAG TPA: Rieske 2Fe-2S domain-containing protein [Thermoplasmata archaeon]|nr:Rieske 2Fe-2S domain-containing protein [Thermoplasmata archaeon]
MPWRATRVAAATFAPGHLREVRAGSSSVLLVQVAEEIYALDPYCPHAGGVLAEGTLEGPRLACPVHAAAFDARSGEVLEDPFGITPPAGGVDPLTRYPVRIVGGMVEVDLP